MRSATRLLLLLALLIVTPALAWPEPAPEEVEANRRVVGKWRSDTAHYARLQADLKAFRALPADRQERMRQLDQELFEADPPTRAQLWGVMDRYVTWLEHLSPAERKKIENVASATERLDLIRKMREQEWRVRLPAVKQKQLEAASEADLPRLIAQFREEERDFRRRWNQALANPLEEKKPLLPGQPLRRDEFPLEIQLYIVAVLMPGLSPEERKQLEDADGKPWPTYARQVMNLAEKHPPVLPWVVSRPMLQKDLPRPVRDRLREVMQTVPFAEREKLKAGQVQQRWPEYGMLVSDVLHKYGEMPMELGPCKPRLFNPIMQAFIERLSTRVPLTDKEKKQLQDADGKWPDYPRTIVELANAHKLPVPGMRLPGPKELWDSVRGDR